MRYLQRLRHAAPVLVVALVGLMLTAVAFHEASEAEQQRRTLRLERAAEGTVDALRGHVARSSTYLRFLGGLVRVLPRLGLPEFVEFTQPTVNREPALQALEWIPRVRRAERAAVEAAARAEGLAGFRIRERDANGRLVSAGERSTYFPVRYVTPIQGNEGALGFDLGSEPNRRKALEQARDSGRMVASEPIRLVQRGNAMGLLVFLPIYRGTLPESLDERRAALRGFVLAVIDVGTWIESTRLLWQSPDLRMQVTVYDGASPETGTLLYTSDPGVLALPEAADHTLEYRATVRIADREWQVSLMPVPDELGATVFGLSGLLGLLGLLATGTLCGYMGWRTASHLRVEALVGERTTALVDATAAIEDRSRRLRAILDTALDGIVTIDSQGSIQTINPAAARIFGYDPVELRGANVNRLMPEPLRSQHDGYLEAYLRTGQANIIGTGREVEGLHKDGSIIPLELRVSEMQIGNERLFTGVLRDLRDQRAAEAALRTSEARLRAVVTGTPIILFAIDRNGIFTLSEGKGLQALGRNPGEVVGLSVDRIYADNPHIRQNVQRALDGESFTVEVLAQGRWTEASYAPTYDAHGEVDGVIGVAFDITERKRAEQLKAEFVSTVSHELRTPLASIVGYVDLILDGDVGPVTDEMREFLEIVAQNGGRLTQLISDILDIEKLETGRISMRSEPTDLTDVLTDVQRTFQVLADKKGLTLTLEAEPGLTVSGDADRLTQLFSNLVSNAVKYTPSGTVRLTATAWGGWIRVEIADSGIGMSPETLEKLFTRFFRADDDYTRAAGGTGLGLAIARAIAVQHGATVDVDSALGKGTVFTVALPSLAAPAVPASGAVGVSHPGTPPYATTVRRALILDDDADFIRVLERTLGRQGILVDTATAAEEAVNACQKRNYEVVVLDYYLPDMSGLDVLRKLRDSGVGSFAAILISGATVDRSIESEAQRLGSLAFLNKKIGIAEIARIISTQLSAGYANGDSEDRAGG